MFSPSCPLLVRPVAQDGSTRKLYRYLQSRTAILQHPGQNKPLSEVSAAGNDNANADASPFYPCVYPHAPCHVLYELLAK